MKTLDPDKHDDNGAIGEQPDSEHDRLAQPVDNEEPPRLAFPVVGIGASAGGLESAIEFFEHMRADSGMAFVLVQHLPPDRETLIPEILSRKTTMPVDVIAEAQKVEPNHVYVIRPGRTVTLREGVFHLGEPLVKPMHNRPVDDFFRSLAEEQRERGIAIVLSGMGSNGTAGAQAVKAVGGLCIAQDPDSAAYPSMPRHLIDAEYADYILRPADMPETLLAYAGHPYARDRGGDFEQTLGREQQYVREILAVLRTRTHHDFSGYKRPTLLRRIQRRMGLARVMQVADYARLLRQTPSEVMALADDLLIHVTGFFRDRELWEVLRSQVIVPLVASKDADSSIRAWVAACSSGEEAYSLAMLLVEESERAGKRLDIKIFATDTAERTLSNARQGIYPGGIESEVEPERLERFFQRDDAVYRIRPELRERVVFAPQNLLQDPPFSRLDIITCRNLLIYLEPGVQQRVLSMLHFGLRDGGTLFLGTSETVGANDDMFETIDKKARIYRRIGPTRHGNIDFPLPRILAMHNHEAAFAENRSLAARQSIAQLTTRALLDHHVGAAVTIDRDYRILYYHGNTSPFLRQPAGEPTRELMSVIRDTLRGAVRAAVQRAIAHPGTTTLENAWVYRDGGGRAQIAVSVSRASAKSEPDCFVVSFREVGEWLASGANASRSDQENADNLRRVRDELQSTVDELQTSNEELKAAHEEVVSTNEELQSTNEELETSREEMQSLNEELSTVNGQLQAKMEEYQAVTSDLASLLTSTDIAVLFLDTGFRIRRFTPQVKQLLDVIATDVGRPFSDLAQKFDDPLLLEEARLVLERLTPCEREIAVGPDRWFLRRITPYRTAENRIDGVVITFVETTARRRAEEALRRSEEQFRRSIQEAPVPVIMMAENGEVLQLSSAWTELTGHTIDSIPVMEAWLSHVDDDGAAAVRSRIRDLFRGAIRTFEVDFVIRTRDGQDRHWRLHASSPGALPDGRRMCVGMAVDLTDRKRAEAELESSKQLVEAASEMKDRFLANISHELRTPLSVILMWSKLLTSSDMTPDEQHEAYDAIVRAADAQRRLVEDLLDTTHIASGKLRVSLKPIELNRLVRAAIDVVRPLADSKDVTLSTQLQEPPDVVLADAGRLEQVVWILLTNAVKFTPSGGAVEISTCQDGDWVDLRVRDTGAGIPADFLPHLFHPFAQAETGRTRSGLGLRLSIARSLVQLHGGAITANSDGLGKGATFTIRLPRHVRPVERDALHRDGNAGGQSLGGVSVLLVEDNVDAIRAIKIALENAGARVEAMTNPLEALEAFREVAPHVVISDLSMPELTGLELMQKLRAIEKEESLARAKAIALTALATGHDRTEALESGFDIFLAKPIDPEMLIAETHALIHAGNN
ncbi:MAG TPA: CheR family methyltransferase [Candidatus Limnocylindrales bacterium]|nr:CheR family methyltransferase [Candidatus Limnocylindrales bacterium]